MFTIDYETENYAAIVKTKREKKLDVFLKFGKCFYYELSDLFQERKTNQTNELKNYSFS